MINYSKDIESAYSNLIATNNILLERYILPHKGNVDSTSDIFHLDVKSYLILLHAAIEDYIEGISVFSSQAACDIFKNEGVITLPLVFIFAKSKVFKDRVSEKAIKNEISTSPKDFLLDSLGDIHSLTISNAIDNNGINIKYLNNLLHFCGINFDSTDNDFISWKSLADYRGDYAHAVVFNHGKKPTAKKILSPEDAMNLGEDCLSFSLKIKNESLVSLGLSD